MPLCVRMRSLLLIVILFFVFSSKPILSFEVFDSIMDGYKGKYTGCVLSSARFTNIQPNLDICCCPMVQDP